jgi:hypothetical protein
MTASRDVRTVNEWNASESRAEGVAQDIGWLGGAEWKGGKARAGCLKMRTKRDPVNSR